ncbi:MAG: hypothetical protein E7252_01110 [Lachnospira sp.]|nr:hypothetical protein [Lachnospira sp.]
MQNYVQFLNVGFGIINSNEPVDSWDKDAAMERAITLDNPDNDVKIIGFRFYEMDNGTITRQSGVYYILGEVFTYPKVDNDVSTFIKNTNSNFEVGQELIKIMKPFTMVYKFNPGDEILDTQSVLSNMKLKKEQDRKIKLEEEIVTYKTRLVNALKAVQTAIEDNQFNNVPLSEIDGTDIKALDILNDRGQFSKHIDHLRNIRVEIMNIDKFIKEVMDDL